MICFTFYSCRRPASIFWTCSRMRGERARRRRRPRSIFSFLSLFLPSLCRWAICLNILCAHYFITPSSALSCLFSSFSIRRRCIREGVGGHARFDSLMLFSHYHKCQGGSIGPCTSLQVWQPMFGKGVGTWDKQWIEKLGHFKKKHEQKGKVSVHGSSQFQVLMFWHGPILLSSLAIKLLMHCWSFYCTCLVFKNYIPFFVYFL